MAAQKMQASRVATAKYQGGALPARKHFSPMPLPFCFLPLLAFPQNAPPASIAPPAKTAPSNDFVTGVYLLRRCRQIKKAITLFEQEVKARPQETEPRVALASALTCRAAILTWAVLIRQYQQPGGINASLPQKPITTIDDDRLLTLSDPEAIAEINRLLEQADQEWQQAITLAPDDPAKATVFHYRGWARRLFYESAARARMSADVSRKGQAYRQDFQKATELAPDAPLYWRSKGDGLIPQGAETPGVMEVHTSTTATEALEAYYHYLELRPRESLTWYRVFLIEASRDKDKAVAALDKAIKADSTNAVLYYQKALFLHEKALPSSSKEADIPTLLNALETMERGNTQKGLNFPLYQYEVPPYLKATWHKLYPGATTYNTAQVLELSLFLPKIGETLAEQKPEDMKLRARTGWACIQAATTLLNGLMTNQEFVSNVAQGTDDMYIIRGSLNSLLNQSYDILAAVPESVSAYSPSKLQELRQRDKDSLAVLTANMKRKFSPFP
jgi:tetratricopeptide (TPR) repeat protein